MKAEVEVVNWWGSHQEDVGHLGYFGHLGSSGNPGRPGSVGHLARYCIEMAPITVMLPPKVEVECLLNFVSASQGRPLAAVW